MFKTLCVFCTIAFSFGLSQSVCASSDGKNLRAYTVDDMLKIEGVGAFKFSSDSTSIIFEYQPPYDERGLYGVDRGGKILQLSALRKSRTKPLFEHKSGTKYWLGNASPDGRRLLIFQADNQGVSLAVYDFETGRLTAIDESVQVEERYEMNAPVWINENEIIMSGRSKNWSQYSIRTRRFITDRDSALRENAFAGEASDASVSTKPTDLWYDGALLRYNVNTKRSTVLANGRFGNFRLSTYGKKLAVLRLGQRLLHFPVDQLTDFVRFETQLYIFDLENADIQSFSPENHVAMESLRWSKTGSKLSFFAWDKNKQKETGDHYVWDSAFAVPFAVDIDGFALHGSSYAGTGVWWKPIPAEWLGSNLIVQGSIEPLSGSNEAQWYFIEMQERKARPIILGDGQSTRVQRFQDGRLLLKSDQGHFIVSDSTPPKSAGIGNDNSIEIINGRWGDEITNRIAYSTSLNGQRVIGFTDPTQDTRVILAVGMDERVLASDPEMGRVITRLDTAEGGEIVLHSPNDEPSVVFEFNTHVSQFEHPRWETIEYSLGDGTKTFSCVILPYNYDPEKSYPTIVDVYPGTGKECKNESGIQAQPIGSWFWGTSRDLLSANGYLVVRPSNTYDRNSVDGVLLGGLTEQVDAALDALVAAGMTDPNRIGIWGHSNGSLQSLWLASTSDRYKAIVPMFGASSPYIEYFHGASSPVFQLYLGSPIINSAHNESKAGLMPRSMGVSAIIDPVGYIESSPFDRAKHICAPVMMVHSDLDGFSTFHYEALFTALYRLGKTAELVRYYGEGHGLRSPGNIRDFYDRVLPFFDKHVKSGAPMAACSTRK